MTQLAFAVLLEPRPVSISFRHSVLRSLKAGHPAIIPHPNPAGSVGVCNPGHRRSPCLRDTRTEGEAMSTMTGTIKRLVSDKGFGFILASDGDEYFFHNSACTEVTFDQLREGQAVTFDRGHGPKGPRGENVRTA